MKIFVIITMICASCSLSACSTNFKEKKAPCSPMASAGNNPCELIPINFSALRTLTSHS